VGSLGKYRLSVVVLAVTGTPGAIDRMYGIICFAQAIAALPTVVFLTAPAGQPESNPLE